MRKPNSSIIITAIITAVCVLSGSLFLSCPLPVRGNYGILVIALPGGAAQAGARAAVSDAFSATLSYRVDCDGPGGRIARHGQAGASLSIPLNAGEWAITVTVFNAADQRIGGGMAFSLDLAKLRPCNHNPARRDHGLHRRGLVGSADCVSPKCRLIGF